MSLVIPFFMAASMLAGLAVMTAIVLNLDRPSKTQLVYAWITVLGFASAVVCFTVAAVAASARKGIASNLVEIIFYVLFAAGLAWILSLDAIRILRRSKKPNQATG